MPLTHNRLGGTATLQNQLSNFKLLHPVYHSSKRQMGLTLQAGLHVVLDFRQFDSKLIENFL